MFVATSAGAGSSASVAVVYKAIRVQNVRSLAWEAFKLLLSDASVKAVLVNIFGGIMKCDILAEGIVEAAKVVQLKIPLVVRLEGTNVQKGKDILKKSGLKIIPADNLRDAAEKAIAAVKG